MTQTPLPHRVHLVPISITLCRTGVGDPAQNVRGEPADTGCASAQTTAGQVGMPGRTHRPDLDAHTCKGAWKNLPPSFCPPCPPPPVSLPPPPSRSKGAENAKQGPVEPEKAVFS